MFMCAEDAKMIAFLVTIFCISWLSQIEAGAHGGFGDTSVQEGFCAPHYPAANVYRDFLNDLQPEGGFYFPYGSLHNHHILAEQILGRLPSSADHISDFCPRLEFKIAPNYRTEFGTYFGFGRRGRDLTCEQLGNQHACYTFVNKKWQKFSQFVRTLTDQKSFIVFVRCDLTGAKSWGVMSTKPRLDEATEHRIATHILALGFDIKKFRTIDFSHCQRTNAIGYSKRAPSSFNHIY